MNCTGTVTLLFTDVAQSTELVKRLREHYGDVLDAHRALLREVFTEHGGMPATQRRVRRLHPPHRRREALRQPGEIGRAHV